MLTGQRFGLSEKARKKNPLLAFLFGFCFDKCDGMKAALSGKYFMLGNWRLARSADLKGQVSINNKAILIESLTREVLGLIDLESLTKTPLYSLSMC